MVQIDVVVLLGLFGLVSSLTNERRNLIRRGLSVEKNFLVTSSNIACCRTLISALDVETPDEELWELKSCWVRIHRDSLEDAKELVNRKCSNLDGTFSVSNVQYVVQDKIPWGIDISDGILDNEYNVDGKYTGKGVNVYVIDTGINQQHEDLAGRVNLLRNQLNTKTWSVDDHGHGTHCAGIVAGTTYGLAKEARVYGIKVLDNQGSGDTAGVIAGIATAVQHMRTTHRAGILSMSLGGGSDIFLDQAVQEADAAGAIIVLAAGNDDKDACQFSPGRAGLDSDIVTVGSMQADNSKSSFSNWGACVDIYAPGSNILSTWIGSSVATAVLSGTSMAAPAVAGALSLLLEKHKWDKKKALNELRSNALVGQIRNAKYLNEQTFWMQVNSDKTVTSRTMTPTTPTSSPTLAVQICTKVTCIDSVFQSQFSPPLQINPVSGPVLIAQSNMCKGTDDDFSGHIVVVKRGGCFFTDKVANAFDQGAMMVLLQWTDGSDLFEPGLPYKPAANAYKIPSVAVSMDFVVEEKAWLYAGPVTRMFPWTCSGSSRSDCISHESCGFIPDTLMCVPKKQIGLQSPRRCAKANSVASTAYCARRKMRLCNSTDLLSALEVLPCARKYRRAGQWVDETSCSISRSSSFMKSTGETTCASKRGRRGFYCCPV